MAGLGLILCLCYADMILVSLFFLLGISVGCVNNGVIMSSCSRDGADLQTRFGEEDSRDSNSPIQIPRCAAPVSRLRNLFYDSDESSNDSKKSVSLSTTVPNVTDSADADSNCSLPINRYRNTSINRRITCFAEDSNSGCPVSDTEVIGAIDFSLQFDAEKRKQNLSPNVSRPQKSPNIEQNLVQRKTLNFLEETGHESETESPMDTDDTATTVCSPTPKRKRIYPVKVFPILPSAELIKADCCGWDCLKGLKIKHVNKLRDIFEEEVSGSTRNQCLLNNMALTKCQSASSTHSFRVGDATFCDKAYGMLYQTTHRTYYRVKDLQRKEIAHLMTEPRGIPFDDTVISEIQLYIDNVANAYGELMPHKNRRMLPMTMEDLYNSFLIDTGRHCDIRWFRTAFKLKKDNVDFMQYTTSMNPCNICQFLKVEREKISSSKFKKREVEAIDEQRAIHLGYVINQRSFFQRNKMRAKHFRTRHDMMMIITDGMDQKKSEVPSFGEKELKEMELWQRLDTHIFGCCCVGRELKNHLDFKQVPPNTNQNLTSIMNMVLSQAKQGPLPDELYVQLDNTGSQNKNQFIFSFFGYLVEIGMFKVIFIYYLMKGHTHCDIDRIFSRYAVKFRKVGNPTLAIMRNNIETSYQERSILENDDDPGVRTPQTEIVDEVWAIDDWLKPHMLGLHSLRPFHGFRVAKYPEIGDKAGMQYQVWGYEDFLPEVKPLFKSLPTGKPAMQVPNYDAMPIAAITTTIDNMFKKNYLDQDQKDEWTTFLTKYLPGRKQFWASKTMYTYKMVDKKKIPETVVCDWMDWVCDATMEEKRKSAANSSERSAAAEELKERSRHTILEKFAVVANPVQTNKEYFQSKKAVEGIQLPQIEPGKHVILRPSTSFCLDHYKDNITDEKKCHYYRPKSYPWIAEVVSTCDPSTKMFKVKMMEKSNKRGHPYVILDGTEVEEVHFDSVMQLLFDAFTKGMNIKSGIMTTYRRLIGPIDKHYMDNCKKFKEDCIGTKMRVKGTKKNINEDEPITNGDHESDREELEQIPWGSEFEDSPDEDIDNKASVKMEERKQYPVSSDSESDDDNLLCTQRLKVNSILPAAQLMAKLKISQNNIPRSVRKCSTSSPSKAEPKQKPAQLEEKKKNQLKKRSINKNKADNYDSSSDDEGALSTYKDSKSKKGHQKLDTDEKASSSRPVVASTRRSNPVQSRLLKPSKKKK